MASLKMGALAGLLAVVCFVSPAAAPTSHEIVYFSSGRVLPVLGHTVDQNTVILRLHGGGEVRCDPMLIRRITLDLTPRVAAQTPRVTSPARTSLSRMLARPYGVLIREASERYDVDQYLIHALIEAESGYDPTAQSGRGAMGLMQLMPALAAQYAVHDPYDPASNIDAGTRHLGRLINRFGIAGALAAYNAGEGSVRKFEGPPPFPETRRYVSKIFDLVDANQD